jgi:ribosomal protein L7/L12
MNVVLLVVVAVAAAFLVDWFFRSPRQRLRNAGLYPPAGQGTQADVERLLRGGRKIEAIKLFREIHGVGLKEAKEGVEALMAEMERLGPTTGIAP